MHIREFQKMMRELYLHRDSERGLKGTYMWLTDEIEELREALGQKERVAIEREFADVLAWLASLANIAEIDLESAALEKYPHKCPKCKNAPCSCTF
jgi:NTP pyrophosphatase (non-canonical NTP hydrolase)